MLQCSTEYEGIRDERLLQCVAVYCRFLQCVVVCCSVLQCVTVCCSVAVCCIVLQCVAVLQCVSVCCSVLQCVALCCSVLQCVNGVWVEAFETYFLDAQTIINVLVQCNTLQQTITHFNKQ